MFTPEERRQKIESYGRAPEILREGLSHFPREMWDYKPASGWSIREIIIHIADSEANAYVRCRRFIAEPGSGVYGYDEDAWAKHLGYVEQNPEEHLALFGALRRCTYLLLRTLPDAVWANTIEHSESGTMSFESWLDIYDRHPNSHLQQMQEVFDAWKKSGA